MTLEEHKKEIELVNSFNAKWKDYIDGNHYGLGFGNEEVVKYLDKVFQDLIKIKGFKFQQIKMKFNQGRFYSTLENIYPTIGRFISARIEGDIERILNREE